jgi:hypothetical protein
MSAGFTSQTRIIPPSILKRFIAKAHYTLQGEAFDMLYMSRDGQEVGAGQFVLQRDSGKQIRRNKYILQ